MTKYWRPALIGLLVVLDLAIISYVVWFSADRKQDSLVAIDKLPANPEDTENAGDPGDDKVVGPLLMAGAPDGSVIRIETGDCAGRASRAWTGALRKGAMQPVAIEGLQRAYGVIPTYPGWSIVGADETCQLAEWVSAENAGTTWERRPAPTDRWFVDPTNNYAIQTPVGSSPLDGQCDVAAVHDLSTKAYVLCRTGTVLLAETSGDRVKLSNVALSTGAQSFHVSSSGTVLTLGRAAGCDAQLTTPDNGAGSEPHCFGNGNAPLGVTIAGDLTLAQVGYDLWQRGRNGEWVLRAEG